jgi:regulator of sirC expression with transglutaminase-like and TPR domain
VHSSSELQALLFLLDDPDEEVYRSVSSRLADCGTEVLPLLEKAWEDQRDAVVQRRIEVLTHQIQYADARHSISRWAADDAGDLLEAALILDRYAFPERDPYALRQAISELRQALWLELQRELSPLEKVHVINQYLYRIRRFQGPDEVARDPRYSYLSAVLEGRKGNPLGLGLLYAVLAQQLELPVYGIPFPQHPLLAMTSGYLGDLSDPNRAQLVEFYIYPYRQGAVVTARDIVNNLIRAGLTIQQAHYLPVSNADFFSGILQTLEALYREAGQEDKAGEIAGLREAL